MLHFLFSYAVNKKRYMEKRKNKESTQDNLLELVDLLQQVDEIVACGSLNQYSMHNYYYKGIRGNDSELRTWFYHCKTLKKNGIIRGK